MKDGNRICRGRFAPSTFSFPWYTVSPSHERAHRGHSWNVSQIDAVIVCASGRARQAGRGKYGWPEGFALVFYVIWKQSVCRNSISSNRHVFAKICLDKGGIHEIYCELYSMRLDFLLYLKCNGCQMVLLFVRFVAAKEMAADSAVVSTRW